MSYKLADTSRGSEDNLGTLRGTLGLSNCTTGVTQHPPPSTITWFLPIPI